MGRAVKTSRSDRWHASYELLCIYREINGHCNIRILEDNGTGDLTRLRTWTNHQRTLYRKGKLHKYYISRLEWIDFQWTTHGEKSRQEWKTKFDQLLEFKVQNGHCRVPTRHEENPQLAAWVKNQRANKFKMSQICRDQLDNIGFCWDPNGDDWDEYYRRLVQYKSEHNTTDVTLNKKNRKDYQLYCWVRTQRKSRKEGTLGQNRVDRLSEIDGFCWGWVTCKTAGCLCRDILFIG